MRSGNRKDEMLLNGLRSEWITKWLDDIGLPQYKDQFYDARIDGRVLNHLTVVRKNSSIIKILLLRIIAQCGCCLLSLYCRYFDLPTVRSETMTQRV